MARIVFTSAGYLGDVSAYVPVANELVARGHDVLYAMPRAFHRVFDDEGFDVAHGGTDFSPEALAADPLHTRYLNAKPHGLGMVRFGRYWLREWQLKPLASIVQAVDDACRGADVVVTHPAMAWSTRIVTDKRDIPVVTGHLFPTLMIPSSAHPPPWWGRSSMPGRVGRAANRAAWSMSNTLGGPLCYDRAINRTRHQHGLPPERSHGIAGGLRVSRVLVMTSRHYYTTPADAPSHHRVTGFSTWAGRTGEDLPDDLRAFLNDGDAPVLVTMGTSASSNARARFELVASMLDSLRLRGVFLVGHDSNLGGTLAGRSGVCSFAPLGKVLPRCRAAIHSGSYGTNAAVLGAGLPSVVMPTLIDQIWHGDRVSELGCGLSLRRGWSEGALRRAISAIIGDQAFAMAARQMADRLAEEDGIANACSEIEDVLEGG